jgi:hypothetical protein
MKTKFAAEKQYQKMYGRHGYRAVIFQYPAGHWGYAIATSPVYESIKETGYIYPEINCKAKDFSFA